MEFNDIIPLGYNCMPRLFRQTLVNTESREYFFDDIGIPMWGIYKLFVDNFTNFYTKTSFSKIRIFDKSQHCMLTNNDYYIRFTQNYQLCSLDSLFSQFELREKNLINLLSKNKRLLFIRYEEPMISDIPHVPGSRIIYEPHIEHYKKPELFYVNELSNFLQKKYPLLDFVILFIGNKLCDPIEDNVNMDNKIITVSNRTLNVDNCSEEINKILTELNISVKLN